MDGGHVPGTRKRCLAREPQAVQLIADPDLPGDQALVHDHVVVIVWLPRHAGGRCNSGAAQNAGEWRWGTFWGWQFLLVLPVDLVAENALLKMTLVDLSQCRVYRLLGDAPSVNLSGRSLVYLPETVVRATRAAMACCEARRSLSPNRSIDTPHR